jgi:hypothetical protein
MSSFLPFGSLSPSGMNPRLNETPFLEVGQQSGNGNFLLLNDAHDVLIAAKTKQAAIAQPTKFLQAARAACVVMILKRRVDFFIECPRACADNKWTFADSTAIILLGHRDIILF